MRKGNARCFGQDIMRGEWRGRRDAQDRQTDRQTDRQHKGLLLTSLSGRVPDYYAQKTIAEKKLGRKMSNAEFERDHLRMPENETTLPASGTSIFDPVLCELVYRWFSPVGGLVLDPFAGGSVRGIVAAKLGRRYVGVELSRRQVKANREQAREIVGDDEPAPAWVVGDSRKIGVLAKGEYDLVFSCPPYADLEVYSEDPADISTLDYPAFLKAYREIIAKSIALLRQDRFACFVVGDVRDKKGLYRNFVSDTISAFHDAGARLYNEAVLVTSVGSLPIRIGRQFEAGRKLGKTHQNVLVFVKGDPKRATVACGPCDVTVDFGQGEGEAGSAAGGEA